MAKSGLKVRCLSISRNWCARDAWSLVFRRSVVALRILLGFLLLTPLAGAQECERLGTMPRMLSQAGTNLCWFNSGLQMMEQMAGEPLSVDALLMAEIKSRALARFLGHDTPWDGGAGPTRPFALALEHGLVPESAWNKGGILVRNYHEVFARIEPLLSARLSQEQFLTAVDDIIKSYTGSLPPSGSVVIKPARELIGDGASLGFDFRDVKYDPSRYGLMGEVAWTTIISRRGELVPIRSIIDKQVYHVDA